MATERSEDLGWVALSLRLHLAAKLSLFPEKHPHIDTQGLDHSDWLTLADEALAALGLDDLDAAIARARAEYRRYPYRASTDDTFAMAAALKAALTAKDPNEAS